MEKQIYVTKSRVTMSKIYAISTWFYVFIPIFMMEKGGWNFANAWPILAVIMAFILFTNYWFFKVAQQQEKDPFLIFRDNEMVIKYPMYKPKTFQYSEIQSAEMIGENHIKLKTVNNKTYKIQRMLLGHDVFEEVCQLLNQKV